MPYYDVDPSDIDPETGHPYANYSSPLLDTSFHDGEMDVDDAPERKPIEDVLEVTLCFQFARDAEERAQYGWNNYGADCLLIRNLETGEIIGTVAASDLFDATGARFEVDEL